MLTPAVHHQEDFLGRLSTTLEGRGWDPEYVTNSEAKITFPDPETSHPMRFSEFWLSWRLDRGYTAYGVGDDIGSPWRARLLVDPDASPETVAAAADQEMHLLWHCDQQRSLRDLSERNRLLSAMEVRMMELGRRLIVTPRAIRAALVPSGRWTP
ncbi:MULTISPECIES: hypothetical protein [Streptomyces]|uniref:Uncharacterized protein n=1 Tax=Streptomyces doudnae TaxID=3075536 RepID=A0ABD5ELU4_9ACTN|nr:MULTISPECIES: hypothetical protein [unclassified Streptomyces]MDT0435631.1 hypothetical protein [Streptomyces sp. DSM 41981]MYQ62585.1 hypothetical protein [Streptomyces sp. SID4950]SCD40354.1 hypothetical protein GA0115242_104890 [Streptomyces sp. SolWspMP-5a-2]